MEFLGLKTHTLAAERYYSLVDNAQSKRKGSMRPESVKERCLLRTELLQEIAECANSVNNGLQTVNEATTEDEAAVH